MAISVDGEYCIDRHSQKAHPASTNRSTMKIATSTPADMPFRWMGAGADERALEACDPAVPPACHHSTGAPQPMQNRTPALAGVPHLAQTPAFVTAEAGAGPGSGRTSVAAFSWMRAALTDVSAGSALVPTSWLAAGSSAATGDNAAADSPA
jgi:hypothetical protein